MYERKRILVKNATDFLHWTGVADDFVAATILATAMWQIGACWTLMTINNKENTFFRTSTVPYLK